MSKDTRSRVIEIESWFRSHENGEFCVMPMERASIWDGSTNEAKTIIYTTKHHCLPRIKGLSELPPPVATISRGGLPVADDLRRLNGQAQTRIFIGDADPPDLLAFAWLREHVPFAWHGVNDAFLNRHATRDLDCIRIKLSTDEQETVPQLGRFCPDYRELLGEYCASLIDAGFKIELEGAIIDCDVPGDA